MFTIINNHLNDFKYVLSKSIFIQFHSNLNISMFKMFKPRSTMRTIRWCQVSEIANLDKVGYYLGKFSL